MLTSSFVYLRKKKWRIADSGFWLVLLFFVVDFWRDAPRVSLYFDLTWLMLWSAHVKLNELEDTLKRKPYSAPRLSRLQWAELTREQQAWTQNERASRPTDDPKRP